MPELVDQIGHKVSLQKFPERIISLVPSQTELLYDLGLGDKVVGITKFCIHPDEWFRSKTRVGGTKSVNAEKIAGLNPDLIIANKEENEEDQIKDLQIKYPVYSSDIFNLNDSLKMIHDLGELTDTTRNAIRITQEISSGFRLIEPLNKRDKKTLYFIWQKPFMCAGSDTFINDMLSICGFENIISQKRYPELSPEQIKELNPDYILLSSEPFPFKEKHISEFKKLCPNAKISLVDGEYFSWYGSRLLNAPKYFNNLLKKIS
jgi:ABC-type Fe3+-hydroxamate transport system substrate-binding protein